MAESPLIIFKSQSNTGLVTPPLSTPSTPSLCVACTGVIIHVSGRAHFHFPSLEMESSAAGKDQSYLSDLVISDVTELANERSRMSESLQLFFNAFLLQSICRDMTSFGIKGVWNRKGPRDKC